MTSPRSFAAALLLAVAAPALAAPPPAAHAVPAAHAQRPAPPAERLPEIPGAVLIGMAVSGLVIVGFAARRRQPGRSVSS